MEASGLAQRIEALLLRSATEPIRPVGCAASVGTGECEAGSVDGTFVRSI